jgi:hypothetical protein
MDAAQREPYLAAVAQSKRDHDVGERKGWMILCQFCRHFSSTPRTYYDDGDAECLHPLPSVSERQFELAWEGADCWAFRPTKAAREEVRG